MSDANVFFGHHCSHCGTKIGVAVSIGDQKCPGCGSELEADVSESRMRTFANATCIHCRTSIGMMVTLDAEPKCPSCKKTMFK